MDTVFQIRNQTFLINLGVEKNDLDREVSWLTESRTRILPKHCPTLTRGKKGVNCEAVKVLLFGDINYLFGCFKSCLEHLSPACARLLVSPCFQHLLCSRMSSLVREDLFSEVSGLMIIKEIPYILRAHIASLIIMNCI